MTTLAQVKQELRAAGYLVDNDPWPVGAFHLLTLGSKKTSLSPGSLSTKLYKITGIANVALPRNPRYPNLYHFIAYRSDAGTHFFDAKTGDWVQAPFLVGEIEDYLDDVDLAMVNAVPLAHTPDEAAELAQAAEDWAPANYDTSTAPILIGDGVVLNRGTWYILRVLSNTGTTIRSGEIKSVLEERGADVLAPDEGVLSHFFWSTAAKDGSTRVFYRPANGPGSNTEIQGIIREAFPAATTGVHTAENVVGGQPQLDTLYRAQDVLGSSGEGIGAALDALSKILKAVPVLIWVGVGLLGLFAAGKVYGAWKKRK